MNLFEKTQDEVTAKIEDYLPWIKESYDSAFDELLETQRGLIKEYREATLAGIIHDLVIKHVKSNFKNKKNVRCFDSSDYFMLVFSYPNLRIMVRFNKFNKDFLTSKTLTESARQYDTQKQPSLFEDETANVNLYAGYNISKGFAGINCYISCPSGVKKNHWSFNIDAYKIDLPITTYHTEMQIVNPVDDTNPGAREPVISTGHKRIRIKKENNPIERKKDL